MKRVPIDTASAPNMSAAATPPPVGDAAGGHDGQRLDRVHDRGQEDR